jgi:Uma2 family endonuclease
MVAQSKTQMRADEFYNLPQYQEEQARIELINGEAKTQMPPILLHQEIAGFIHVLLWLYAAQNGGRTYQAPTEVYLDEENIFEPDVFYLKPDTKCIRERKRIVGAPDLVVEVLSPSTAKRDRQEKYRAYQQHGVSEYWIVDPAHSVLEAWRLQDGEFQRLGAYGPEDTLQSPLLGQGVAMQPIFSSAQA